MHLDPINYLGPAYLEDTRSPHRSQRWERSVRKNQRDFDTR